VEVLVFQSAAPSRERQLAKELAKLKAQQASDQRKDEVRICKSKGLVK
jgi:hypothetical protein